MEYKLDPAFFYEGVFDSSYKFKDITVSPLREAEHYELEIYTELGGTTYINDASQALRPGLFICTKPGDIRYTELPLRCYYVKVLPEMDGINALLDTFPTFSYIHSTEKCVDLINSMLSLGIEGNDLTRTARFLELLSILSEESRCYVQLHSIHQKRNRAAVEETLRYLETHYTEKFSLEEIAGHAHFSPIYFHKLFKTIIGKTPHEYLATLRINEAKRLLLTEKISMEEIAVRCGFASQAYFDVAFKKETGMTPSKYKRQQLEKYSF